MILAGDLRAWLDSLPEDVAVGIGEDGLTLLADGPLNEELEVGRLPYDDHDPFSDDEADDPVWDDLVAALETEPEEASDPFTLERRVS